MTLLRAEFGGHRREPLAFYTRRGSPLVTYRDGKMASDAVRQMWDDLRVRAEVPEALSFKYLRKFVADWMTREGGEAMGQVALSHASQTVLGKHYTTVRDFAAFNDLQRRLHAELTTAGLFTAASNPESANNDVKAFSGGLDGVVAQAAA